MPTKQQTKPSSSSMKSEPCVANPVGWVEIPANDLNRAKTFYGKVFGFEFQAMDSMGFKMAMFPMTRDGSGASGSLIQGSGYTPSHDGTMVYFSVEDIEGTLKKLSRSGGKVLRPKMSIGEYGSIAVFEDCEGNRVALHTHP